MKPLLAISKQLQELYVGYFSTNNPQNLHLAIELASSLNMDDLRTTPDATPDDVYYSCNLLNTMGKLYSIYAFHYYSQTRQDTLLIFQLAHQCFEMITYNIAMLKPDLLDIRIQNELLGAQYGIMESQFQRASALTYFNKQQAERVHRVNVDELKKVIADSEAFRHYIDDIGKVTDIEGKLGLTLDYQNTIRNIDLIVELASRLLSNFAFNDELLNEKTDPSPPLDETVEDSCQSKVKNTRRRVSGTLFFSAERFKQNPQRSGQENNEPTCHRPT